MSNRKKIFIIWGIPIILLIGTLFWGTYKKGKLHGPYEWFYENGQLKHRRNYKNGKIDGLLESFHKNGQLRNRQNFKNGQRVDGLFEIFYPDGQLEYKRNYNSISQGCKHHNRKNKERLF